MVLHLVLGLETRLQINKGKRKRAIKKIRQEKYSSGAQCASSKSNKEKKGKK